MAVLPAAAARSLRRQLRRGGEAAAAGPLPRRRSIAAALGGSLLFLWAALELSTVVVARPRGGRLSGTPDGSGFVQLPGLAGRRGLPGLPGPRGGLVRVPATAGEEGEAATQAVGIKVKYDAADLAFETNKFNLLWMKLAEAKEQKSPDVEKCRQDLEEQAALVELLGGSRPAVMLTEEEARKKAELLQSELTLDRILNMSGDERWVLAQGLGPAFPVSLVLSYTTYWSLNVPFIAYAYVTQVQTGSTTMPLVMAGAYAASIPFKPVVYIVALLATTWTANNVMPVLGKVFNFFRLPDEKEWDRV
mmetsp:Transcript_50524/g.163582  ORF Transcript_50524/g.163582 Transcript_50524/m.163582 type:complete len:305 (-) Transcript_50524:253-1167(-)